MTDPERLMLINEGKKIELGAALFVPKAFMQKTLLTFNLELVFCVVRYSYLKLESTIMR